MWYFIDDAVGDSGQDVKRNTGPVSGHSVNGCDSSDGHCIVVRSLISHHANGFHVGQGSKVLPDVFFQTGFCDLLTENRIGFPDDFQLLFCHISKNADAKTRTRERLAPYHFMRQAQLFAQSTDFILEQGV